MVASEGEMPEDGHRQVVVGHVLIKGREESGALHPVILLNVRDLGLECEPVFQLVLHRNSDGKTSERLVDPGVEIAVLSVQPVVGVAGLNTCTPLR